MSGTLNLVGIARKAGKIEAGEEPTGAAARSKSARLIILASDAADNSARRARGFAEAGGAPLVTLDATKAELGAMLGRASCAMLAVTDTRLAAAIVGKLHETDLEKYAGLKAQLDRKADRVSQREKEKKAHEKNIRTGKKKK